jgi:hypothetical protein
MAALGPSGAWTPCLRLVQAMQQARKQYKFALIVAGEAVSAFRSLVREYSREARFPRASQRHGDGAAVVRLRALGDQSGCLQVRKQPTQSALVEFEPGGQLRGASRPARTQETRDVERGWLNPVSLESCVLVLPAGHSQLSDRFAMAEPGRDAQQLSTRQHRVPVELSAVSLAPTDPAHRETL